MPTFVLRNQNFAGPPGAADSAGLVFGSQFMAAKNTVGPMGGDFSIQFGVKFPCIICD